MTKYKLYPAPCANYTSFYAQILLKETPHFYKKPLDISYQRCYCISTMERYHQVAPP